MARHSKGEREMKRVNFFVSFLHSFSPLAFTCLLRPAEVFSSPGETLFWTEEFTNFHFPGINYLRTTLTSIIIFDCLSNKACRVKYSFFLRARELSRFFIFSLCVSLGLSDTWQSGQNSYTDRQDKKLKIHAKFLSLVFFFSFFFWVIILANEWQPQSLNGGDSWLSFFFPNVYFDVHGYLSFWFR